MTEDQEKAAFDDWWNENGLGQYHDQMDAWRARSTLSLWQPIESAPKDGTRVMLYCPKAGQYEAFWEAEWVCYVDCLSAPTHWMPLTKAPE